MALLLVCAYTFREQQSKEACADTHEHGACPLEPVWVTQRSWAEERQPGLQDLKIHVESGIQTITEICRNTFLVGQSERCSGLHLFKVDRQGQSQLQWFLRAQFSPLHQ